MAQIVRFVIVILFNTVDANFGKVLVTSIPFVNDAISWAGSGSLILLSQSVRKEYIKYYFGKNSNKLVVIPPLS